MPFSYARRLRRHAVTMAPKGAVSDPPLKTEANHIKSIESQRGVQGDVEVDAMRSLRTK
jgi:hypothetical protein